VFGPLAILRESWLGERELPADVNDRPTADKYLIDLRAKLEVASEYILISTLRLNTVDLFELIIVVLEMNTFLSVKNV